VSGGLDPRSVCGAEGAACHQAATPGGPGGPYLLEVNTVVLKEVQTMDFNEIHGPGGKAFGCPGGSGHPWHGWPESPKSMKFHYTEWG